MKDRWGDSNKFNFIFFWSVNYLLWIFKDEEWTSTNNKGSLFSSSSLNIGHRHGLARRCAAWGLRRRGTEGVSPTWHGNDSRWERLSRRSSRLRWARCRRWPNLWLRWGATEEQRGCGADEVDEHGGDWVALPVWRPTRETERSEAACNRSTVRTVTHHGETTTGFIPGVFKGARRRQRDDKWRATCPSASNRWAQMEGTATDRWDPARDPIRIGLKTK
jgi:hypothetical protein